MLRRGEVWSVGGRAARTVLVVSGNMFNELPDHPHVLGMDVVTAVAAAGGAPAVVALGEAQFAVVDTIGRVPKHLFAQRWRQVDVQTLTNVDNWLFKILATN